MHNHDTTPKRYRVKLGHTEVLVQAVSPAAAITAARRRLAQELPRFYDVIRSLEATRFEVSRAA